MYIFVSFLTFSYLLPFYLFLFGVNNEDLAKLWPSITLLRKVEHFRNRNIAAKTAKGFNKKIRLFQTFDSIWWTLSLRKWWKSKATLLLNGILEYCSKNMTRNMTRKYYTVGTKKICLIIIWCEICMIAFEILSRVMWEWGRW